MKKTIVSLSAFGLIGLGLTGCATQAQPQTPRQSFLTFIPQGELGSPHDMEYLIEHAAGDGGYYGTKEFPGTLKVTNNKDGSHLITWKLPTETIGAGSVTFKYKLTKDGQNIIGENGISNYLLNTKLSQTSNPSNNTTS